MKPLTVGSLFSGIGGFDLGLERAGMAVRWQVEIDPWCRRVLANHWPDVPRHGDIRRVGAHNLESVDVLCGGFPCQDVSNAGLREGIDGKRSGLWTEYVRLIRELRPRFVAVENVSGLLVRGMERVLGDLAACGYHAEWDSLPAAAFGAPHIRERVFIVAVSSDLSDALGDGVRVFGEREREQRRQSRPPLTPNDGEVGPLADAPGERVEGNGPPRLQVPQIQARPELPRRDGSGARGNHWKTEPRICRVVNGVPEWVDRIKGLGNAVVPQIAEWLGERIVELALVKPGQPGEKAD